MEKQMNHYPGNRVRMNPLMAQARQAEYARASDGRHFQAVNYR